jgi:uncharacterized protein YndB with AHSA1/START domain
MRKIQQSIAINASPDKVWRVLTDNTLSRQWYNEFSEGTYAIGEWKEGGKMIWADKTNSGMVGTIVTVTADKGRKLDIEFTGEYANGQEVYDSEMAMAVKGGHEVYQLEESKGITTLSISVDMGDEYFESMSKAWESALQVIRKLAEQA